MTSSTLTTKLKWIGSSIVIGILALFALSAFEENFWDKYIVVAPPLSSVTAEIFKFEDYPPKNTTRVGLESALKKLFPAGTTKKYVDGILVGKNGAREEDTVANKTSLVVYSKRAPALFAVNTCGSPVWWVDVVYDTNDKLTSLQVLGPCALQN